MEEVQPPLLFVPSSESDTLTFFHRTVFSFPFSFLGVEDCSITRIASSYHIIHTLVLFHPFLSFLALIPTFFHSFLSLRSFLPRPHFSSPFVEFSVPLTGSIFTIVAYHALYIVGRMENDSFFWNELEIKLHWI